MEFYKNTKTTNIDGIDINQKAEHFNKKCIEHFYTIYAKTF